MVELEFILPEGKALSFDLMSLLQCLLPHFRLSMILHGPLKMDWMAERATGSLIPMLCVKIKAFCKGYSSPADSLPQQTVVHLKPSAARPFWGMSFWNAEQPEILMIYSTRVHRRELWSDLWAGLVSGAGALPFMSANSSKQHLTIKGKQMKTNNAAASFAQDACLACGWMRFRSCQEIIQVQR